MQYSKEQLDAHCKRPGCRCDHLDCYQGWYDTANGPAAPCQYCRANLHERLWKANRARLEGYPLESYHRMLRNVTRDA